MMRFLKDLIDQQSELILSEVRNLQRFITGEDNYNNIQVDNENLLMSESESKLN